MAVWVKFLIILCAGTDALRRYAFAVSCASFVNTYAGPIALGKITWKVWGILSRHLTIFDAPIPQYYIVYVVWDLFECVVIYFCAVETKGRTLWVILEPNPESANIKPLGRSWMKSSRWWAKFYFYDASLLTDGFFQDPHPVKASIVKHKIAVVEKAGKTVVVHDEIAWRSSSFYTKASCIRPYASKWVSLLPVFHLCGVALSKLQFETFFLHRYDLLLLLGKR